MQVKPTGKMSQVRNWKRVGIIVGIVIAIPLLLFLTVDYYSRQSFSLVQQELENVQRDIMEPAGGVEHIRSGMPYSRGGGLLDNIACGPDVNCPSGTREWFVLIEPGKVGSFTSSILQTEGYKLRDFSDGSKGKLRMVLTTNPIGNIPPPTLAPAGKEWKFIAVSVYHY